MTIHTQIGPEHNTETHTHKMTLTDRHTYTHRENEPSMRLDGIKTQGIDRK